MTETNTLETNKAAQPSGNRKISVRRIFMAVVVLLIVTLPVMFYFCPWAASIQSDGMVGMAGKGKHFAQMEMRLTQLDSRITALETRLRDMNGVTPAPAAVVQTDNAAKVPADTHLQADVVALSAAVAALQTEVKQNATASEQTRDATRAMLAVAISYIQLRDAALSGRAFTSELAALRIAVSSEAAFQEPLAKLEPYAAQGAPTYVELREELMSREALAVNSIDRAQAQNWWERVVAELKGLVSVRPLHGNQQADAFAALKSALQKDDVTGALDAFDALPAEAQQSLGDLRTKLTAKADIDVVLRNLATHFTANTGGQATP